MVLCVALQTLIGAHRGIGGWVTVCVYDGQSPMFQGRDARVISSTGEKGSYGFVTWNDVGGSSTQIAAPLRQRSPPTTWRLSTMSELSKLSIKSGSRTSDTRTSWSSPDPKKGLGLASSRKTGRTNGGEDLIRSRG